MLLYPQVLILVFWTLSSKPAVACAHHVPVIGQVCVLLSVQAVGLKHHTYLTVLKLRALGRPW